MFDYSVAGLWIAIIGIAFIVIIGWRLIPRTRKTPENKEDIYQLQDYITEIKIPEKSPFVGISVHELEKSVKGELIILGSIRDKRKKLVLRPQQVLDAGDILIVETGAEDLQELLRVGKLELVGDQKFTTDILKAEDIGLVEAVVPQGSSIEGRSSHSIQLRSRYQINLLAIARKGQAFKKRLNYVNLEAGDVVLLQGIAEGLQERVARLGFLPLVERGVQVVKRTKAFLPVLIFVIAILLTALQILPVQVAFGGAVLFMILLNVMPVRTIYDSIDWPIIILLAAMIPIGNALQSTGGTGLISHYFIAMSGHISPVIILGLLLITTMTLSDFMNNAATTVVMAPIAVSIAEALKVNIDPFLMTVAIGASCSFLTPVGHQNNTLVMGPGGYKFLDYIRVGLPLELIILAVGLPLIIWAWPLT